MKKLIFIHFFLFCAIGIFAQDYPVFESDKTLEKEKSIVYNGFKNEFDFLIAKSETCYWYEKIHFKIIGFKNGTIKKYHLIQDKKSGKCKMKKVKITRKDTLDYNKLLDELNEKEFFNLTNGPLNIKGRDNEDGTRSVMSISDGHTYVFEIIEHDNYKRLYSYCPEDYFKKFPEMKYRKLFLDCLNIFRGYW